MLHARLTAFAVFASCVTAPAFASVDEYRDRREFLASTSGQSLPDGYEHYSPDALVGPRTITLDYFEIAYDGTTDFGVTDLVDTANGVEPFQGDKHLRVNYGGPDAVNALFTFVDPVDSFGTALTDVEVAPLSYEAGLSDGTVISGIASEVNGNGGVSYFGLNALDAGVKIEWINFSMPASAEFDGVFFDETIVSVPKPDLITLDWNHVGNPGNAADPDTGLGSVDYEYRIGTFEVTNAQYAAFLNSVAVRDPNELYSTAMASSPQGGILRLGAFNRYTYRVKPNMADKPVMFVSFENAARMANWLTNGQGVASRDYGSYRFNDSGTDIVEITRDFTNPNQVFLPTKDEWYKAALHQPFEQGGNANNYWFYATRSNERPTSARATSTGDVSNPGQDVINYSGNAVWGGVFGTVTTVGSAGSTSFYGAFDMNGNVDERTELTFTPNGPRVGIRGGYYDGAWWRTEKLFDYETTTDGEVNGVGFRFASPPCATDFNRNGFTEIEDLLQVLRSFNSDTAGDSNGDGETDIEDLLAVLRAFGQRCP